MAPYRRHTRHHRRPFHRVQTPANALAGPTAFGNTGDVPIIGDWDGLGVDEPYGTDDVAVYRPGNRTFYLRFSSTNTNAITWGNIGDVPITGDWNGDGTDEIGVYRPNNSTFYRRYPNGDVNPIRFGTTGDVPIVGDWTPTWYDRTLLFPLFQDMVTG